MHSLKSPVARHHHALSPCRWAAVLGRLKTCPNHITRLILCALLLTPATLHAISGDETSVKAAFLYNFFKFIQWPKIEEQQEYALCVPHPGKFTNALKPLEGKLVNGHILRVFLNAPPPELKECHMLFLTEVSSPQSYIAQTKDLHVLTVSDHPDFIEQGGMIGLVFDGNRLGFNVNLTQAHQQSVHISAELLKLAQKVIY